MAGAGIIQNKGVFFPESYSWRYLSLGLSPHATGRASFSGKVEERGAGEPGAELRGAPENQETWRGAGGQAGPRIPSQDLTPVSLGTTGEGIPPRQPAPPDPSLPYHG